MTTILLCGETGDHTISDPLLRALDSYGGVQYYSNGILKKDGGDSPAFLVYDCETPPEIKTPSGILLFKNSYKSHQKITVPNGWLCVFESHNAQAAATLLGTGVTAATCGTGPRDTLSIASLDYSSAILSLQRSLLTVSGSVLEPHDVPIRLRLPMSPRQILAVCMVLLASGMDSSNGFDL